MKSIPRKKIYTNNADKMRVYRERRKIRERAKRKAEIEKYFPLHKEENETILALQNYSKFLREENNIPIKEEPLETMTEEQFYNYCVEKDLIFLWTCDKCDTDTPFWKDYCEHCKKYGMLITHVYSPELDEEIERFLLIYPFCSKWNNKE